MALNEKHQWIYRGQIVQKNKLVTVEATITEPTIRAQYSAPTAS